MSGVQIIILRPREEGDASAQFFSDRGIEAVAIPATEIVDLNSTKYPLLPGGTEPTDLGGALFTSPRAVQALMRRLAPDGKEGYLIKLFRSPKFSIGVVAPRTGETVENILGRPPTFEAAHANQKSLADTVAKEVADNRLPRSAQLLFPCAKGAAAHLEQAGRSGSFTIIRSEIYASEDSPKFPERLHAALNTSEIQPIFAVYAPSQVMALASALSNFSTKMTSPRLLCIGPTTEKAARESFVNAEIKTAEHPNEEAMLGALHQTAWLR